MGYNYNVGILCGYGVFSDFQTIWSHDKFWKPDVINHRGTRVYLEWNNINWGYSDNPFLKNIGELLGLDSPEDREYFDMIVIGDAAGDINSVCNREDSCLKAEITIKIVE